MDLEGEFLDLEGALLHSLPKSAGSYVPVAVFILLNGLHSNELISVFFLSICSGLVAATLGTPADVIKTRIMNNPDLYKGTIDCFKKSVSLKSLFASVSLFSTYF